MREVLEGAGYKDGYKGLVFRNESTARART